MRGGHDNARLPARDCSIDAVFEPKDVPVQAQQMADDPRAYLLTALQRVLQGGELAAEELREAIPSQDALQKQEKAAWEQLTHWAGESDVRAKDQNYAAFHFEWLEDLHAQLARPAALAPTPVERRSDRHEGMK